MATYTIRTNAAMEVREAPTMDDAAIEFARGEGIKGVGGVQSLIEAYARIGDGAWVEIEGDGHRYGSGPNGEWYGDPDTVLAAKGEETIMSTYAYYADCDQFDNARTGYYATESEAEAAFWSKNVLVFTDQERDRVSVYTRRERLDVDALVTASLLHADGSPSPAVEAMISATVAQWPSDPERVADTGAILAELAETVEELDRGFRRDLSPEDAIRLAMHDAYRAFKAAS